jgi:hypothetical protein
MFVSISIFYRLIESRTQVVGRILAGLGEPDGWLEPCMSRIDCRTLCIIGVILGNGGAFVLGVGDDVVKEQIITLA